jgi:hypothetical protein
MGEKKIRETDSIAETIRHLAVPGMKPKALIDAVRAKHPDATKKDIARAAFLTVILSAEYNAEDTQALHDLASGAGENDQRTED